MAGLVGTGLWLGLVATVAIDIWALLLDRLAGRPGPNWALVGRWLTRAVRGEVYPRDIKAVPEAAGELLLGWAFHYAVGLAYGLVFVLIVGADWRAAPTFWPAWIFGMATVFAAWLVLQPGLGHGFFASKAPNPWIVRGLNVVTHTVFALGLWVAALAVS